MESSVVVLLHGKYMVAKEVLIYRISTSPERKHELMHASPANVPDVTAGTCAAGLRGEPGSLPPRRVPQGTMRQGPNKLDAQSSTQPLGARLAQQLGQVRAALQGPRRSQIPFSGWELGKKKADGFRRKSEGRAGQVAVALLIHICAWQRTSCSVGTTPWIC